MRNDVDFLECFLEIKMDSSDGDELRVALEGTITEEKQCLEQFKFQIDYCQKQIDTINSRVSNGGPTHDLMVKKRAFEEQKFILNVAGQMQRCSYETKGIQKILYFEKNESSRERIAVEASVMMYEWCEDLQQMTGKQFQDIAKRLLSPGGLAKVRMARKKLGDFFEEEKPILSKVRHNVGAHRDHDFMNEMEILEDIGWSETIERLHRFEEVTLEFGQSVSLLIQAGLKQIGNAFGE